MGIMKFVYDQGWQYRDSYKNYPSVMGTITSFTATNSTIYLGTESGVWVGDLNSNLKDPDNWLRPFPGLMSPVTAVRKSGTSILISTEESLVTIDPTDMMTIPFEHSLTTFSFENMVKDNQGWWFTKEKHLFRQGSAVSYTHLRAHET